MSTKRKAQKVSIDRITKRRPKPEQESAEPKNEDSKSIQSILSWYAPERIWSMKSRMWYLSYATIFLSIILFSILSRYPAYPWMILALIALMVMLFVQGSIPPAIIETKITNKGVYVYGTLYSWKEISYFWFARKKDQLILHIDFPHTMRQARISLLVPDELEFELFNVLSIHETYANPKQAEYNFFARALYGEYQSLSKYLRDLDEPEEEIEDQKR